MDPRVLWAAIVVAAIAAIAVAWLISERQRRARLKQRFGPEYDRTVQQTGNPRQAEAALQARAQRVKSLHIRPLPPGDAERFAERWRLTQATFVDAPQAAVSEADGLVSEVMRARGYPLGDFDQRADDISVDHPHVVSNYRAARDIAQRDARGEASTEDLRQALVHYRALFDELLDLKTANTYAAAHDIREFARGHR
jgi:hypothetical protein